MIILLLWFIYVYFFPFFFLLCLTVFRYEYIEKYVSRDTLFSCISTTQFMFIGYYISSVSYLSRTQKTLLYNKIENEQRNPNSIILIIILASRWRASLLFACSPPCQWCWPGPNSTPTVMTMSTWTRFWATNVSWCPTSNVCLTRASALLMPRSLNVSVLPFYSATIFCNISFNTL